MEAVGARDLNKPPLNDIEQYWTPHEKAWASHMLAHSIYGGPGTVRDGLRALLERTHADELMIVSDMFDPGHRLRSFRMISEIAADPGV